MSEDLIMSRKKRQLAASSIDKLGGLELETILLRLSVYDLVRCKQVCRAWRSIISSDYFVTAHLNRSKSDPFSQKLLVSSDLFFKERPGPFKSIICFSSECMIIVGSVNGLICFAARKHPAKPRCFNFPVTPDNIWIWNPVTELCRKLPSPSSYTLITPNTTTSKFAFWWDPSSTSNGVYKVAKIVSYKNGRTMVDLWESTSPDTWTTVNAAAPFKFRFEPYWAHTCDVLIEGVAAYWIVTNYRGRRFVLSLDLKTLLLESIPLPEEVMRDKFYLFGGKLNGEFVLLHHSPRRVYRIWIMAAYVNGTKCWKKSFKIRFNFGFTKCLGIMNENLVFKRIDNRITLYDLEISRKKKVLKKYPRLDKINMTCDLEITRKKKVLEKDSQLDKINMTCARGFVGSLVSIDGFGFEYNDDLRLFMSLD